MGKKLVIGASGQIGIELIDKLSAQYGIDQVIATDIKLQPGIYGEGVKSLQLDVLDKVKLFDIIKSNDVSEIYLLAALLSAVSEKKIQSAWDLNMKGLFNVLELAREKHIQRVFWPSSIAVYGTSSPLNNTPQRTILEPLTVYGISKMAGERWCEYYYEKFNVDVRSLRYPGIISHKSKPGGGTTDYAVNIFYSAIENQKYRCFLEENIQLPMMFMDDAIRATMEIMNVERSSLSINSSYNVAAMDFTPKQLAKEIANYIDGFQISYEPDFRNNIAKSWPNSISDSPARNDWGWEHRFDLPKTTKIMIEAIQKKKRLKTKV
jgi:nucleoside-diphosphate-sugar epimerase